MFCRLLSTRPIFRVGDAVQVIVSSHMGRPKGEVLEEKRLKPVAPVLSEAIKAPIITASDSAGPDAEEKVKNAKPGEVVLLENTRFILGETKNDLTYAKKVRWLQ